jgi:NADPH:quinone reductase-like Zn-dependent oxidoreductase
MKTYRLNGVGLDALRCGDENVPPPARGEVQVRMAAAAINYRDVGVVFGHYTAAPNLVPFSDGAGTIVAVGDAVEDFAIGDAVVSCFYENWPSGRASALNHRRSFGSERDGMLAELVNLPVSGIVHKPASLDMLAASTLPCAALTAWSALFTEGHLLPGQHVVVEGTGGVALFALQFAKMAGATVTVLSSSDEKLARAAAMGADHLVNYRDVPEWSALVMDVTNGTGADIVIELGGTSTLGQALQSIRMDGLVAVIGVLSGLEATLFVPHMLQRHARMQGITVGHRDDMIAMGKGIDTHGIKPVIDTIFAFDDAPRAYELLPTGQHFGKLVIDVSRP